MGWRIIHISESEKISLYLDNLKVETKSDHLLIPLKDIHSLILDNYKLVASVQLLCKCSEHNINVVVCGVDHSPKAVLVPHTGHHQSAFILRKQIEWNNEKKGVVHQLIVKQKIRNQINIMKKVGISDLDKMECYFKNVQAFDKTNREGHAAKLYFQTMFGRDFIRFNDDLINSGLNYGYSILRSQINKSVVAKGLNASLGIIHYGPYNAFNLSDDVIEPFRPLVDDWVFQNLRFVDEFSRKHREELIQLSIKKIVINGQRQTVFNSINMMVDSLVGYFEEDRPLLLPTIE